MLICYGLCGSFCTLERSLLQMETLKNEGHELLPVTSFSVSSCDTRFGEKEDFMKRIEEICRKKPIVDLVSAEPIGPRLKPDLMIIAPLSGNSMAKIRHGIYDTPLTLAAKAHLRAGKPLLLALASNDALSGNFENLAALYNRKNIYFVPMLQDDPQRKPYSLVAQFEKIPQAVKAAEEGVQLRPLFE